MSMLSLNEQDNLVMVNPIGAVGRPGREQLLNLYSGIPLDAPPMFDPQWAINCNVVLLVPEPTQIQR